MVVKNSKSLPNSTKTSVAQTASLISGTRTSDYVWRQTRTAFNKTIGYSPIASQHQVDKYRFENLVISKEDWNLDVQKMYQNKQGKNKDLPKDTSVLSVKNLELYITKLAQSEHCELDFTNNILPVCFDADAGGGRFVAIFAFLNRIDKSVKLHPFLLYEGSDC